MSHEAEKEQQTAANGPRYVERLVRECRTHHFACDCREARFAELLRDVMDKHADDNWPEYNECDKSPCAWCEEAANLIGLEIWNDQVELPPEGGSESNSGEVGG